MRISLKGKGKRGGARVLYFLKTSKDKVFLLDVYAKNTRIALTRAEEAELRKLVTILETEP